MRHWVKILAVLAGAVLLQACAFVDQEIDLTYTPSGYEPAGSGVVVVGAPKQSFLNDRNAAGRSIVGTVKNGFGAKTADVLSNGDPRAWIADALIAELELAGYTVTRSGESEINDAERGIELSIIQVFVDQDMGLMTVGAISNLEYDIAIKAGSTVLDIVQVRYKADISERSLAGTGSLKAASLKEALEISLGREMPRILTALKGGA